MTNRRYQTIIFNAQIIPMLESGFDVLPITRVGSAPMTEAFSRFNDDKKSFEIENLYMYNAFKGLRPETNDSQWLSNLKLYEFLDKYFPNRKDENGKIRPQVIIFDQFEELFTVYTNKWLEQQRNFFEQIADSLENNPLLHVVFVIREDYLAQLDPFTSIIPERLRPRFRLELLTRNKATFAVKGPLTEFIKNLSEDERRNIESEIKELVNNLLKIYVELPGRLGGGLQELEGEFVEPTLLQVVCQRWWRERQVSESSGEKRTKLDLTNVNKALEAFYEEAIHVAVTRSDVNETDLRKWFESALITSTGTRSIVHRDAQSTAGMSNKVVNILAGSLIRREWRSGAYWYELTHDRLIAPIKNSNRAWREKEEQLRYEQEKQRAEHEKQRAEQERKKKNLALKIAISSVPITILSVILILYFLNMYYHPTPAPVTVPGISGVIPVGADPFAVSVNPSTNTVYVANSDDGTVSVINGKTNNVIDTITVGQNPRDVSVNPSTNTVYVANSDDGTVSVINGKTNTVTANITVGQYPRAVSVNPSTNTVYVADLFVYAINGKTNTVTANITVGHDPEAISVNPSTNTVYVANSDDGTVSVINGKTNTVTAKITVGRNPEAISVNPSTNTVYVANYKDTSKYTGFAYAKTGFVYAINGKTNTVIANITVGQNPGAVSVNPSTNTVYVANLDDSTVSVINGKTNTVMPVIPNLI
jgi:YVTN family beta-propeller protein